MEGDSESQAQGDVASGNRAELGIHRATIKKYMHAEGLPTRQTRAVVAATPSSDTIQA